MRLTEASGTSKNAIIGLSWGIPGGSVCSRRVRPGAGHGGSRGWEVGRRPVQGLFRAVFVRGAEERDVLPVRQVQCPLGGGLTDDGGEDGEA